MLTGLRGRLVALLAITCAITLGACAVALLPPLERRLRDDELRGLIQIAREGSPALARVADQPPRASRELTTEVRRLLRRGGAEVAVVSSSGAVLATTDPDPVARYPDAVRALREHRTVAGTSGSGMEAEAQVAEPTQNGFAVALRKPLDDARGAVLVVRRAFLLAAGVSLLVALLFGTIAAGRVVRRLRRLRNTALRVAELGPLAEFQPDAARDEVGDLTRAFASMQERLREQESARRAFVATASHELRTPLTSLRVMLDGVRADLHGPNPEIERARQQVDRADAQAQRLSALAGDLLDLSRIDAGLPLRSELVELTELVRSVAAEFEVRAAKSRRSVDLEVSTPAWAVADPGSAAQIIRILVDNALRHADGAVSVGVGQRGGMAAISVHDCGPGVSDADRDRIFARFERAASANPGPGFGLGLAIGRELARRMGGDLLLDASVGSGARFVLELPSAPAP